MKRHVIVFAWHGLLLCVLLIQSSARAESERLNVVITAAFVSDKGLDVYEDIAQYIGKEVGIDVRLISDTGYTVADMLLSQGIVQLGFICGLPYTHKAAQDEVELIAIPVMGPEAGRFPDTPGYRDVPGKYYSYTIVRKDSPLTSWADLKGKSYVYNDRSSNSGYNMPRYKLVQLGARSWEDWFSRIVISGSHEESIRLVARGLVDASSVDSLVLDFDRHLGDPDALNVKVIETLFPGGAGIPPVVASKKLSPRIREALKRAFIRMHKTEEGRAILKRALLVRFDPADDSNYDDVRRMEKAAKEAGFIDHVPR